MGGLLTGAVCSHIERVRGVGGKVAESSTRRVGGIFGGVVVGGANRTVINRPGRLRRVIAGERDRSRLVGDSAHGHVGDGHAGGNLIDHQVVDQTAAVAAVVGTESDVLTVTGVVAQVNGEMLPSAAGIRAETRRQNRINHLEGVIILGIGHNTNQKRTSRAGFASVEFHLESIQRDTAVKHRQDGLRIAARRVAEIQDLTAPCPRFINILINNVLAGGIA